MSSDKEKNNTTATRVYMETFGCQMNEYDTALIQSLLEKKEIRIVKDHSEADWVLLNTCAVREHAEERIYGRIRHFQQFKKDYRFAIVGCMARNQGKKLFEKAPAEIHLIMGPDQYRRLPQLLTDEKATFPASYLDLDKEEQYDNVPKSISGKVSEFVTIMRGCNNFCSFCVVPYTRGRERSRNPFAILQECRQQVEAGSKEIILLGQNVNSYHYRENGDDFYFSRLLELISRESGAERIRFTSPHPKDFPMDLLDLIAASGNICPQIHLPLQSGSDRILPLMKRGYNRTEYLQLVDRIRQKIPGLYLSTDIIFGFPNESKEDFQATLDVMEKADFSSAFIFKYSQRDHTYASRHFPDTVSEEEKSERVNQAVALQQERSRKYNRGFIGQQIQVLVEGRSKKSKKDLMGKSIWGNTVIFPAENLQDGDSVAVKISDANSATLFGEIDS